MAGLYKYICMYTYPWGPRNFKHSGSVNLYTSFRSTPCPALLPPAVWWPLDPPAESSLQQDHRSWACIKHIVFFRGKRGKNGEKNKQTKTGKNTVMFFFPTLQSLSGSTSLPQLQKLPSCSVIWGKSTFEPGSKALRTNPAALPTAGSCKGWPLQSCTQPQVFLSKKKTTQYCHTTQNIWSS